MRGLHVDITMPSDDEVDEDEQLFATVTARSAGGAPPAAPEPVSCQQRHDGTSERPSPSSASSIYGAADAAKRAAARAALARWQRRLDAETEQFRVWRTEREAEAREDASAIVLVMTELGERHFAARDVTVTRMSIDTVQLTCLGYPMAPVTRTHRQSDKMHFCTRATCYMSNRCFSTI